MATVDPRDVGNWGPYEVPVPKHTLFGYPITYTTKTWGTTNPPNPNQWHYGPATPSNPNILPMVPYPETETYTTDNTPMWEPFTTFPSNDPVMSEHTKQIKRLMEYLDLPPLLQELLISAAKNPGDQSFWQVMADALEERGQLEEATILRSKVKMVE